jgi:hypothetical protein
LQASSIGVGLLSQGLTMSRNITIYIALGLMQTGSALGSEAIIEKRFTKEELNPKPEFIQAETFGTYLAKGVSLFAEKLTDRQGGGNSKIKDLVAEFQERNKEDYMMQLALLDHDTKKQKKFKSEEAYAKLRHDSRRIVEVNFRDAVPYYHKIKNGVDFKLQNPMKKFRESEKKESTPQIQYGLVLKEIVDEAPGYKQAALGRFQQDDLKYAGTSRAVWTIGPADREEQGRKVFSLPPELAGSSEERVSNSINPGPSVSAAKQVQVSAATEAKPEIKTDPWYKQIDWKTAEKRAADWDMKIGSAGKDQSVTEKLDDGATPGLKFSLVQNNEYYRLDYISSQGIALESMQHGFKLPLIGESAVSKIYNDKWELVETKFHNVLVAKKAPTVNVSFDHAHSRYRAETFVNAGGTDVTFIAEPRAAWDTHDRLGEAGDKFEVKVSRGF